MDNLHYNDVFTQASRLWSKWWLVDEFQTMRIKRLEYKHAGVLKGFATALYDIEIFWVYMGKLESITHLGHMRCFRRDLKRTLLFFMNFAGSSVRWFCAGTFRRSSTFTARCVGQEGRVPYYTECKRALDKDLQTLSTVRLCKDVSIWIRHLTPCEVNFRPYAIQGFKPVTG